MFEKSKTIRVNASVPDADYWSEDHSISITITVPEEFPATELKSVVKDATAWCKKMAEGLSAVLWANPSGRETKE